MEPLTSNNQKSFHDSVKLDPDTGIKKQNDVRVDVGIHNNRDMFVCTIQPFLKHYGPRDVDDATVSRCMERMAEGEDSVMYRDSEGNYHWVAFKVLPKNSGVYEDKTFMPLRDIIEAVLVDKTNDIYFKLVLYTELRKATRGSTTTDACFLDCEFPGSPLSNQKTRGPIEVQTAACRSPLTRSWVHHQMLGACHRILGEDIRRMWIYGLTFENSIASIWYFSRSHSVKSVAFDWIKEPELLVKVLLAFAQATPQEHGIDPIVHLGPAGKHGKDVSFVYEVPGANGERLFFKTGKSRVSQRPLCIAGRATRVWEVTQVTAADGKEEVSGKKVILKDVWLDDSDDHSKTEAENMDAIFKAVDKMVKDGLDAEIALELESNPDSTSEALLSDPVTVARLTMQFINRHELFAEFDDATKERLRNNLTNKKYRSMFLKKLHAWQGVSSKPVNPEACRAKPFPRPKFYDVLDAVERALDIEYDMDRGLDTPDTSVSALTSASEETQPSQARDSSDEFCRFAPRRQSRVIYEEVCTALQRLDTVGDVVDVLCQAIDALLILFAVGWVHRDISHNNVMAYRPGNGQPWVMKLADLEFARRMIDPERKARTDPRTGTPFFMPVEISARKHFFLRYIGDTMVEGKKNLAASLGIDKKTDPKGYQLVARVRRFPVPTDAITVPAVPLWEKVPVTGQGVNHNFQHDLESVFWIFLWVISCHVGCMESQQHATAQNYFPHDPTVFAPREILLMTGPSHFMHTLDSKLCTPTINSALDDLSECLLNNYLTREMFGHLGEAKSYSQIHHLFSTTFQKIRRDTGLWKAMKLVHPHNSPEEKSAIPPIVIGKRSRDVLDEKPDRITRKFKTESAN